jgi:hypothetical protein
MMDENRTAIDQQEATRVGGKQVRDHSICKPLETDDVARYQTCINGDAGRARLWNCQR